MSSRRKAAFAAVASTAVVRGVAGQPSSAAEAVMAWPITISPAWFDPTTAPPQITPFGILNAIHDALSVRCRGRRWATVWQSRGRRARTASHTNSNCAKNSSFTTATPAESVTRDGRLSLAATRHASAMWIEFADQWDPKSPWHDRRARLALNHALDRRMISQTCPALGIIVPSVMDFALQVEPPR